MKLFSSRSQNCFCAFCKSPRRVYTKRRLNAFNIMASAVGSTGISFIVFQSFDPRSLIVFIGFLILSEIFIQTRWRIAMTCRHCGFDPVLYLKDTKLAVEKVQRRLEDRKKDPLTFFAKPLQIPKRSVAPQSPSFREEAMGKAIERAKTKSLSKIL